MFNRNVNRGNSKESGIRICSSLHKPDYTSDFTLNKITSYNGDDVEFDE